MGRIIKQSDIFDIEMYNKTFYLYINLIKLLCFLNFITFKIFEDRLLSQAEKANDLMIKQIELCIKK